MDKSLLKLIGLDMGSEEIDKMVIVVDSSIPDDQLLHALSIANLEPGTFEIVRRSPQVLEATIEYIPREIVIENVKEFPAAAEMRPKHPRSSRKGKNRNRYWEGS